MRQFSCHLPPADWYAGYLKSAGSDAPIFLITTIKGKQSVVFLLLVQQNIIIDKGSFFFFKKIIRSSFSLIFFSIVWGRMPAPNDVLSCGKTKTHTNAQTRPYGTCVKMSNIHFLFVCASVLMSIYKKLPNAI